jgi:hypothetical protein
MSKYLKFSSPGQLMDPTAAVRGSLSDLQATLIGQQERDDKLAKEAEAKRRWEASYGLQKATAGRQAKEFTDAQTAKAHQLGLSQAMSGIATSGDVVTNQKAIDAANAFNLGLNKANTEGEAAYDKRMKDLGDKISTALLPTTPTKTSGSGISYTTEDVKGTQYEKYKDPKTGKRYLLDPSSPLGEMVYGAPEESGTVVLDPIEVKKKAPSDSEIADAILKSSGVTKGMEDTALAGFIKAKEQAVPTAKTERKLRTDSDEYKAEVADSIRNYMKQHPESAIEGMAALNAMKDAEFKYAPELQLSRDKAALKKIADIEDHERKMIRIKAQQDKSKGANASTKISQIIGQSGNPEDIKSVIEKWKASDNKISDKTILNRLYELGASDMKELGWFDFGKKDL